MREGAVYDHFRLERLHRGEPGSGVVLMATRRQWLGFGRSTCMVGAMSWTWAKTVVWTALGAVGCVVALGVGLLGVYGPMAWLTYTHWLAWPGFAYLVSLVLIVALLAGTGIHLVMVGSRRPGRVT